MSSTSAALDRKLLKEVKKSPGLFDKSDPRYKSRKYRTKEWNRICGALHYEGARKRFAVLKGNALKAVAEWPGDRSAPIHDLIVADWDLMKEILTKDKDPQERPSGIEAALVQENSSKRRLSQINDSDDDDVSDVEDVKNVEELIDPLEQSSDDGPSPPRATLPAFHQPPAKKKKKNVPDQTTIMEMLQLVAPVPRRQPGILTMIMDVWQIMPFETAYDFETIVRNFVMETLRTPKFKEYLDAVNKKK